MTDALFFLLCNTIPKTFVSVNNDETFSKYYFYMPSGIAEDAFVEIICSYSYTDPKNSYAKYQLYIDGSLISNAIQPVFTKKRKYKISANMSEAERLETLLKVCSNKVILQEFGSHKTHMLKTFLNPFKQKTD